MPIQFIELAERHKVTCDCETCISANILHAYFYYGEKMKNKSKKRT